MAADIETGIKKMPVSDVIKAIVAITRVNGRDNRTRAAELLGLDRQRMDYMEKSGTKNRELIEALERARKALGMSKAAFWDFLVGSRK
jgi:hypothetical protein